MATIVPLILQVHMQYSWKLQTANKNQFSLTSVNYRTVFRQKLSLKIAEVKLSGKTSKMAVGFVDVVWPQGTEKQ